VATASKLGGDASFASTIEFDEANGSWVAVALSSDECRGAPAEAWQVFKLQPRPDGALTGEYTATTSNSCGGKSTVTLTRTGDVDLDSLPDPVTLPPRALSPAEALSGRYHHTRAFTNGQKHVRRTATHGRFHKRGTRRDWRAESGLAAGG
jgi:serine/threonine-protein kinase